MPVSYFSQYFLFIFLPIFIVLYAVFPKKYRFIYILFVNYLFYWLISGKLIIYVILSTLSIHYLGIWMKNINNEKEIAILNDIENKKEIKLAYKKRSQGVLIFGILLHIGVLVVLKYSSFLGFNINSLLGVLNIKVQIPIIKFLLPIGISFYTLTCISYLVDVYNNKIEADTNLFRLALFVSFFPQIIEGPIVRYKDSSEKLYKCENIKYDNLILGLQRIMYGVFKKIVIADRLNFFIETIFNGYGNYSGIFIFLGAIGYTVQLYMEFSGTMDLVIGIGNILGINLPENFRQPFFSKTISEFWSRWHITLGTFFKDYVFYPLTLSKGMKKLTLKTRKVIGNFWASLITSTIVLFVVWLFNGLWHGAAWQFIFFGLYHFILITVGNLLHPLVKRINNKLHIDNNNIIYRIMQISRTFVFVIFGELIFRSNSLTDAFKMIGKIFTDFNIASLFNGTLFTLGMDMKDYIIILVALIIVFGISLLKEKNIDVNSKLYSFPVYYRWPLYYAAIMFVIIFGAYGSGYLPVDPIYGRF